MKNSVIRSKVRVPAVAEAVIERGRVVDALERAADGRRILQVVAPPGSGKTTAVVQLLGSRPGPHAWLTLGAADGSPGRLVTYLAAAVEGFDPDAGERTAGMLARGVAPADCAALLAERLPAGATLVIDDLHLIESRPPAQTVLRALLEAIPPEALVVLVSRRLVHLNLSRAILTGRSGIVSGDELSFTDDEVGELLAAQGVEPSPELVSACGGWAAGIVFGALRASRPPSGPLVADDPFFAYLGAEVLDPLPADVRRAVVGSAVLHSVSAAGLEALMLCSCGETMLRRIRGQHLPVTVEPEGLRYHPRFREFLLSRLREEPGEMRTLLARHARRLMTLGHPEEAADRFVEAGEREEAAAAVLAATPAVAMRGDSDKVLAWCEAIGEETLSRNAALRGCQIQAIIAARRSQGPAFVEALRASGEYDRLVAEDPDAATMAVFGLHLSTEWASLPALLPPDEASPGARALRFVLRVGSGRVAPREWRPTRRELLSPNASLFICGLYLQGRLAEVERMAALVGERPDRPHLGPWEIATLRKQGRLGEARAAFDASRDAGWATGFGDFWRHLEGELVFAEGDRERGLGLVRDARALTRSLGHQPADRAIFAATEGKMLVRLGRLGEAVALLETTSAWCSVRGLPCFGEWAETWLAAALLARGEEPGRATALLEGALAGMREAGRSLERAAALAFLAEARWRAGDAAGHHAAADDARAAAQESGTLAPLLGALREVPDVPRRRLAAGGPDAAAWSALAAPDDPAPAEPLARVRLVLGTLGRPRAVVDGDEREIAPLRALEVAASVARAGAEGLSRAALAQQVMDDSADAANYLRQVIHRLRRLAPEGVELVSDNGRVRWSPHGAVVTEDQLLTQALARARRETGPARREALAEALELADRGPLVLCVHTAGAARLRDDLSAAVAEARLEYAELLLAEGRPAESLELARASVGEEPLREDGWRLLMRATAAARGASAAVPVYAECARALEVIGLRPSRETSRLLDHLRDPVAGRA
jgi:DNA-binding SARP family transcriptional activator